MKPLLPILFIILITGCDTHCKGTIPQHIYIENKSNHNLNLEVCISDFPTKEISSIEIEGIKDQVIYTKNVSTGWQNSGPDSFKSCNSADNLEKESVAQISLDEADALNYTLCLNQETKHHIILDISENCPDDYERIGAYIECGE